MTPSSLLLALPLYKFAALSSSNGIFCNRTVLNAYRCWLRNNCFCFSFFSASLLLLLQLLLYLLFLAFEFPALCCLFWFQYLYILVFRTCSYWLCFTSVECYSITAAAAAAMATIIVSFIIRATITSLFLCVSVHSR